MRWFYAAGALLAASFASTGCPTPEWYYEDISTFEAPLSRAQMVGCRERVEATTQSWAKEVGLRFTQRRASSTRLRLYFEAGAPIAFIEVRFGTLERSAEVMLGLFDPSLTPIEPTADQIEQWRLEEFVRQLAGAGDCATVNLDVARMFFIPSAKKSPLAEPLWIELATEGGVAFAGGEPTHQGIGHLDGWGRGHLNPGQSLLGPRSLGSSDVARAALGPRERRAHREGRLEPRRLDRARRGAMKRARA